MDVKSDSDIWLTGKFNFPVTAMGNETSILGGKRNGQQFARYDC